MSESKPGDPGRKCAQCIYSGIAVDNDGSLDMNNRVCKRFPPNTVALAVPSQKGLAYNIRSMWPKMGLQDFCWEQKPRDIIEKGKLELPQAASQDGEGSATH